MGVVNIVVWNSRKHFHVVLILHVNNGQGVLIVTEAYLTTLVIRIWPIIYYTLCIVNVSILSKTAGILGQ